MTQERDYQPEFGAEDLVRKARRSFARNMAKRVIKQFKLTGPPVQLEDIAKARGLTVIREDVDATLSGQLYPAQREILINTLNRSIERQRFTLAHEIGHWDMQHFAEEDLPPDSQGYEGAYESGRGSEGRSPVEIEANTYAAELLMPSEWIKRENKPLREGRADALAELYVVSRMAMFYQLIQCRML